MGDWADEKAREWLSQWRIPVGKESVSLPRFLSEESEKIVLDSLAASYREVQYEQFDKDSDHCDLHLKDYIEKVRRVVEELMGGERNVLISGDYILSRLEKL